MSVIAPRLAAEPAPHALRESHDPSQIYYTTKARHFGKTHPPAAAEQINPAPEARALAALDMMFGYFG